MHCASCVASIEGALSALEGVTAANVNLATARASVAYDPGLTSVRELVAAVEQAGYTARDATGGTGGEIGDERERTAREDLRTLRAKFSFAAVTGALLLLLSFAWSPFGERATMWVMLVLAAPLTWPGRLVTEAELQADELGDRGHALVVQHEQHVVGGRRQLGRRGCLQRQGAG